MAEFKRLASESLKSIKKDPSSTPSRKKLCSTLLKHPSIAADNFDFLENDNNIQAGNPTTRQQS